MLPPRRSGFDARWLERPICRMRRWPVGARRVAVHHSITIHNNTASTPRSSPFVDAHHRASAEAGTSATTAIRGA